MRRLRQSKISAFCLKDGEEEGGVVSWEPRKKRPGAEVFEESETTTKRKAILDDVAPDPPPKATRSPSAKRVTLDKSAEEEEGYLDEALLKAFENDPFLSPKKKESLQGNVLEEKVLGNENGLDTRDLENNAFVSPKKRESPKKRLSEEKALGKENWLEIKDFEDDPFVSPKKSVLVEGSWWEMRSEIGFERAVRCAVVDTRKMLGRCPEQVLLLREEGSEARGVCRLREAWMALCLSRGDVVSVRGKLWEGRWVVDNGSGYVVVDPESYVSNTAVVGSLFCMRQGVLRNFFKEMFSEESWRMVIGRLVHELFQKALKRGARTEEDLKAIIAECLESPDTLHDLFLINKSVAETDAEMKSYVRPLKEFLDVYVSKCSKPTEKSFLGSIESVLDIEEVLKSRALGLQGRVDVTVRMRTKDGASVAPLELKTGRPSFSPEHRMQLALYVLLMKELGKEVESGLLLYLRDNLMEKITPGRDEIRDVLLLRNRFVELCKEIEKGRLADPTDREDSCAKCPQFRVCKAFLKAADEEKRLSKKHSLRTTKMEDVKESHVKYFAEWNEMIWVEFGDGDGNGEGEGEVVVLEGGGGEFRCELVRVGDWRGSRLGCGGLVEVVDEREKQVCRGRVVEVRGERISVLAERRVTESSGTHKLVRVKPKFFNVYLSNLGWFLKEEFEGLRELIIDKRTPRFDQCLDKADFREKCLKNLLDLNKDQRRAILKCLLCQDYLLVKGPPGTGKTQTIVTLIRILLALNKRVLVAGHTNSSVDNILLKLEGVDYLRLGSLTSIREDIRKNSYPVLKKTCSSINDLNSLFQRKLIASTCMGIDAKLMSKIKVEYCILDESGQILQPEALRPLLCCKKFLLVGDQDQLPPVVRSPKAKALGMSESIFHRLLSDEATVSLRLQYRMNSEVNALANALTYGGLLECGSAGVGGATMRVRDAEEYRRAEGWVSEVLSAQLEKSVVFVDTSECFQGARDDCGTEERRSVVEVNLVVRLVRSLLGLGLEEERVGVISPFLDQVGLLKRKLSEEGVKKLEVSTVDQFQGRDKEVILVSCTKENRSEREASEHELLSDKRRLTVAVTRAKHKLIILGDRKTLVRYAPLKALLGALRDSQFVCLADGQKGFFWKNFIK